MSLKDEQRLLKFASENELDKYDWYNGFRDPKIIIEIAKLLLDYKNYFSEDYIVKIKEDTII